MLGMSRVCELEQTLELSPTTTRHPESRSVGYAKTNRWNDASSAR